MIGFTFNNVHSRDMGVRKAGRYLHGRGARVPRVFMATPLRILDSATRKKCTRYHFPMNSTERHEARYQRRKAARIEKKAKALKEFGDFGAVFSFDHLYASYRASIKGVGWKASTQRYKSSALAHIAKTQEELLTGKYRSRGFYEFDLVERGKPRHIRSVHISERVVQRCLCDYCLVPALSKSFIYDNGASLPRKGYDFAVSRVTRFLADHYRRYGNEGYADFRFLKVFRHSASRTDI